MRWILFALLWAGYQLRVRQLHHQFEMTLEARVGADTNRFRICTIPCCGFHGLLLRFQTASHLLPDTPAEAKDRLDIAIQQAGKAITEGRDAVQGLRSSSRRTQRYRGRDQDPATGSRSTQRRGRAHIQC